MPSFKLATFNINNIAKRLPVLLDKMVAKGYLSEGITVVVRKYEDRWVPPHAR